jgi:hypothetical protein
MEIPLKPKGEEKPVEKPLEEKNESVTVPAGTYSCHYEKRKQNESVSETWTSGEVPLPVKTVVTTDSMKSTTVLVKFEAK